MLMEVAMQKTFLQHLQEQEQTISILFLMMIHFQITQKGSIAQGSLDTVYGNSNKVATVFNRNNSLHIGDTIQFAGEEVEITCALSQGLFGDDLIIICSQETFDRIMGDTKYGLIGIQLD